VAEFDEIGLMVRERGALGGPDETKRTSCTVDGFELGFVFAYHAVKVLLLDAMILERAGL